MERSSVPVLVAVVMLAAGLFTVDLWDPQGLVVRLPYVVVVLLALWFPERWKTYATAVACTALTVLGLYFSPGDVLPFWAAALNRFLGIFTLWIAAFLGLATKRTLQLQEANRRLQQEIVERERLQAQFLRTQRLESVGVLASGIAHDFNNLLTPILMAAKLLKEDRPEEERQHLLTTLQASAERGAEMVGQLLAFAGGADGHRVTLQPRHIIKEIKTILEHTVPKTIQIQVDLADNLKPVHADATQLSQVLMNLCVNARDAMPTGGTLTIQASNALLNEDSVRMYPDARPGSYVLIAVTDTGVGIPADVLDKVFDPFFTTKGAGKGTGLGLATVLGIVRGHGGFINVYSEVGRGSRFAVYLPVVAEEEPLQAEKELPQQPQQPKGRGEMILVVDDESFILEAARATLEGRGYRVMTARDGREAIDLYQQHQGEIQAVLLDMMMPGMDGQATMTALEKLDPGVRIVASSGLRVSERVAETLAAGQGAFLPKPYTDEQMLATLAKVLTRN